MKHKTVLEHLASVLSLSIDHLAKITSTMLHEAALDEQNDHSTTPLAKPITSPAKMNQQ